MSWIRITVLLMFPLLQVGVASRIAHADEFTRAAGYYASAQWEAASEAFERLIGNDPPHPRQAECEFYQAESWVQLARYRQAAVRYQQFLEQHEGHPLRARAMFRLGECLYFSGQLEAAARRLREFMATYPSDTLVQTALPYLAFLSLDRGDRTAGKQLLDESISQYPSGPLAAACRYRLIEIAFRDRRAPEMFTQLGALEQDVTESQRTSRWRYWHGLAQWQAGQAHAALRDLEGVVQQNDDPRRTALASYHAAVIYAELNQPEAARPRLEAVIRTGAAPELVQDSRLVLGRLAIEAGRIDEALWQLARIREGELSHERRREAERMEGELCLRRHEFSRALEIFKRLAYPDSGELSDLDRATTLYSLAQAYHGEGQFNESLDVLNQIQTTDLRSEFVGRVAYAQSLAAAELGDAGAAETHLVRALQAVTDGVFRDRVRGRLVSLLIRQQRPDDAWRVILDWQPSSQGDWYFRRATTGYAKAAIRDGQFARAIASYQRQLSVLTARSDRLAALSGLAWCHLRREDLTEAVSRFEQLFASLSVSERRPEDVLAYASACERTGRGETAREAYGRFIVDYPTHSDRWRADLKVADSLCDAHQLGRAIDLLEQARGRATDAAAVDALTYRLAWTCSEADRLADARKYFLELHARGSGHPYWADVTYRLARLAFEHDELDAAQQWVDELLTRSPAEPELRVRPHVLFLKAQIAVVQQDGQAALRTLDELLAGYPASSLFIPACLASAEVLTQIGDYDSAVYRLEAVRDGTATLTVSDRQRIHLRLAQIWGDQQQWQRALDATTSLLAEPLADHLRSQAQAFAATCQEHLSDTDHAPGLGQPFGEASADKEGRTSSDDGSALRLDERSGERATTELDRLPVSIQAADTLPTAPLTKGKE